MQFFVLYLDQDPNQLKRIDGKHPNYIDDYEIATQVTIDLTDSENICAAINTQTKYACKKNLYKNEYKYFKDRVKNFKLEEELNENLSKSDAELESLKKMLDDWIFWTSKNNLSRSNRRDAISDEDVHIFKGYLLYLLNVDKNIEKLSIILRIFKRLIEKSGSFEWIENYKHILASVQTDFYEEYNSTLNIY